MSCALCGDNTPGAAHSISGCALALRRQRDEATRLLRLTCERLIGTPVAEQSSSLADISLAIDAALNRLKAPLPPEVREAAERLVREERKYEEMTCPACCRWMGEEDDEAIRDCARCALRVAVRLSALAARRGDA